MKESYVDSEIVPKEDSLLTIAKSWFQRGARSATPKSDIEFRNLQPNWEKYQVSRNSSGQPWISVRMKKSPASIAYLVEMSVVVDKYGKAHGIIKEFASNPYKGNSPLTIYTIDGKVYLQGMYIRDKRVLRINSSNQLGYRVSSLVVGTDSRAAIKRANDPIRDIDEVVIMPPEQGEGDADGDGDDHNWNPNPGGGGGGNNNGNVPVAPPEGDSEDSPEETEIIDLLHSYPCASSVLQYMKTSNTKISDAFTKTFGGPQTKINITFLPKAFPDPNYDGGKLGGYSIYDAQVALSTNMLENATQEYMLVTMYHEFWHAYLDVERYHLGSAAFDAKYPELTTYSSTDGNQYILQQNADHSRFSDFFELMRDDLQLFNPNLPANVVEALITTGIIDGRSNDMINLNNNERQSNGNSAGTKC
ncbi:hypothetical protein DC487_01275 [Sphingobacterium corticibacter]|uniref:Uncharacterized protein n=2 Tax=Sphingobacterium corticibacter TaxID=2171749 RepID=A0A2T8HLH8_9SPHI|nr:hypothetical protein DC487_01275 [Sphingobacterium corticibacter]